MFVTGTDTGVGKTILAAAICAALRERGEEVSAFKPVVTGLDEPPGEWPPDHEMLHAPTPYRFGPPVSPHYAAELAGETIDPSRLVEGARSRPGTLICEGVGGLMVPLTPGYLVRDFAVDLGLPVVIAARTGLGTINHSLLTVEAARAAGLRVAGVVMTPWPDSPEPIEASNRATVERLSKVPVSALPRTTQDTLVAAGGSLPLGKWLNT